MGFKGRHHTGLRSRLQNLRDWEEIAVTLNAAFSSDDKPVQLKARGCRERMELLLKKYKDKDTKSLIRYINGNFLYMCACEHASFCIQVWN